MSVTNDKIVPSRRIPAHKAQNDICKSVVDRAVPARFPVSRSERNVMRCAHGEKESRRDVTIHLFANYHFSNPGRRELFEHPRCSPSKTSLVPAWAGIGWHLTFPARALATMIAVVAISASMNSAPAGVFERPNSYLGDTGWNHCLELWFEMGAVTTKEGTVLPLRLRFSSEVPPAEGLFGAGWWCPLLESRVTRQGDNSLIWTTPGGITRRLVLVEGHMDFFTELGWASSARVAGDRIRIESEGWQFDYADGELDSARAPDGEVLHWRKADGSFPNILDDSGSPLLGVSKKGSSIRMTAGFASWIFAAPERNSPQRWVLEFPDGKSQTLEAAGNGTLSLQSTNAESRRFQLDIKTGHLRADDTFTYEMRDTPCGLRVLHRIGPGGETEWYHFDKARGVATYKRQDDRRIVSSYHREPGGRYGKVFRIDTVSESGSILSSHHTHYDPDGTRLSEWSEGEDLLPATQRGIRSIGLKEARDLHRSGKAVFVDARKAQEYAAGHIPGALGICRFHFERDFPAAEERLRNAGSIVVYCVSRQCEDSSIVGTRLWQKGLRNIVIFEGGWAEWWKN